MGVLEMMSVNFRGSAKIPAIAFTAVALFIGLVLLALQILLQKELMAPDLQYFCAEDRSTFCFASIEHASTISRAPWSVLVSLVLVPAFLAVLVMRLQKTMPPRFKAWVVAAMWLAFAFYLAVPIANINFAPSLSGPVASDEWTLYPSLSSSPVSYQLDANFKSLQINKVAVAILLILNLFGFTIAGSTRLRSTLSKIVRIGFASLMIWAIWMLISLLSDFLKFISMDRNFGTVFFDPISQPDKDFSSRLLEHLSSPEIWNVAAALCCLALWLLA